MRLQNLTKTWGLKGNLKINHLKKTQYVVWYHTKCNTLFGLLFHWWLTLSRKKEELTLVIFIKTCWRDVLL